MTVQLTGANCFGFLVSVALLGLGNWESDAVLKVEFLPLRLMPL